MNNKPYSEAYQKLNADIASLEQDVLLYERDNFIERAKALDFLELHFADEEMNFADLTDTVDTDPLNLYRRVQQLKQNLNVANEKLFAYVLAKIRDKDYSVLLHYIRTFEDQVLRQDDETYVGYDELDTFIWGLLEVDLIPEEPKELEPDMVYYQPLSTRTILKAISELHITPDDIFYDLGSGLGHVPILVNLLTGIKAKGVEIEEFYCRYSNECLKKLELSRIEFIHGDARYADYHDGTIFYMYTPFRGKMLRHVLAKLEEQAKQRQITICTYGPCTEEVTECEWLQLIYQRGEKGRKLGIFRNV